MAPFRKGLYQRILVESIAACAAALLLCPAGARLSFAIDPRLDWMTVETEHFSIHFHDGEEKLAAKAAAVAEEAWDSLTSLLGFSPPAKVQLILGDQTDSANGFAQTLPYDMIELYVTAPESTSTLNDYDDWLRGLIFHELAHIIQINTIRGLPLVFNNLFGKQVMPNAAWPGWYVEGVATYVESACTLGGRVRSSMFDMMVRAAFLDGAFPEIDEATGTPSHWPRGTIPYLYGSFFLDFIARKCGEETISKINWIYGGRVLPFAVNSTADKVTGKTFLHLWDEWRAQLAERYGDQAERIREEGVTPTAPRTAGGESKSLPRYCPGGGCIAYYSADAESDLNVSVVDLRTGASEAVFEPNSGGGFDLNPDGSRAVVSQIEIFDEFYTYEDLYLIDLGSGPVQRITEGMRAREPVFSPDGEKVAFVANDLSTANLALLDLDGGGTRLLTDFSDWSQVSTPAFSPDGGKIACSIWTKGGFRDIYLIDPRTAEREPIAVDRAVDISPAFSPDGKYVFFSSDRSGVYNVFAYEIAARKLWRVTNVLTGAFDPQVSPDGKMLAVSLYSSNGFDIHEIELRPETWKDAAQEGLGERREIESGCGRGGEAETAETAGLPLKARSYSPLPTLLPRSWFPFSGVNPYGGTIGLFTAGADVLDTHSWGLIYEYGLWGGGHTFNLQYRNRSFYPVVYGSISRDVYENWRAYRQSGRWQPFLEEGWRGRLEVSFPFRWMKKYHSLAFAWVGRRYKGLSEIRFDPEDTRPVLPEEGALSGLSARWYFSNVRRYSLGISPEKYWTLRAELTRFDPAFGSKFSITQLRLAASQYLQVPSLKHHVLALELSTGFGWGDMGRRRIYSIGGPMARDILLDLIYGQPVDGDFLRGYPPGRFSGNSYYLLNAEYRLPLFFIERGIFTLPIYARRMHMAFFSDFGRAFPEGIPARKWTEEMKVGAGVEARLDLTLAYFLPATLRLGLAKGFAREGGEEIYLLLGGGF